MTKHNFYSLISLLLIFSANMKAQLIPKVPSLLMNPVFQNSMCKNIKGLDHPVNIFHTYFQQILNNFTIDHQGSDTSLVLYREIRENISRHQFIFKMKNQFTNLFEYVGVLSVVPPQNIDNGSYQHIIIRYINAKDLESIKILMGIYDLKETHQIPCRGITEALLDSIVKRPVMPFICKSYKETECVNRNDLKYVAQSSFEMVRRVLRLLGFNLSLSDLLMSPAVVDQMKDSFEKFDYLQENFNMLRREINLNNEVDLQKVMREKYVGDVKRCKDVLDIDSECSANVRKGREKCLQNNQTAGLKGLMITYLMVDQMRILTNDEIQSSSRFVYTELKLLNMLHIQNRYQTIKANFI